MIIGTETIKQQGNLNLESPEEIKQRLVDSIREARRTGRSLTEEELDFARKEKDDLDDNPYQNEKNNH